MKKLVSTFLAPCCAATLARWTCPGVTGGSYALQVTSMKEARFRSTVRQQFDFSCGSAAVATLLSYHYDTPVSERQVFDAMYALGDQQKIRREGFSLLDMKRYLAQQGFIADGYQQPLHKLAEAGFPAIVRVEENGYPPLRRHQGHGRRPHPAGRSGRRHARDDAPGVRGRSGRTGCCSSSTTGAASRTSTRRPTGAPRRACRWARRSAAPA